MCYQARSQAEVGKYRSHIYGFHVPWIDYDAEMCVGGEVRACVCER